MAHVHSEVVFVKVNVSMKKASSRYQMPDLYCKSTFLKPFRTNY